MDDYFLKISHLIEIRRFDNARKEIEEAFLNNPQDTSLFYLSARLSLIESDIENGIDTAIRGLEISPDNELLRYVLFDLFEENKELSKAEELIIDLIKEHPRDADYIYSYARLMLFTFNLEKANQLICEALRIAPGHSGAQLLEVVINIARGKLDVSQERLSQLVNDDPESEYIMRHILIMLIEKKKHRAAMILAQELLHKNPYDKDIIDMIIDLRTTTHWSALPLWPIHKFGWPASVALWIGFIILMKLKGQSNAEWLPYLTFTYLGWCIYTWVHSPVLTRLFRVRGV